MPHVSRGGLDGFSVARCRQLRRRQTRPEERLWRALRNRALAGLKFRRQHPFGPFILDFYCQEVSLAVEVDGWSHVGGAARTADAGRTAFLERRGLQVLRFMNREVLENLEGVLVSILERAAARGGWRRDRPGEPSARDT